MSFGILIRDSLDSDALKFCQQSGASEKVALSFFVRGVKQAGLWDSMVCWPLRSSQNAGAGNVAYALGGLAGQNLSLFSSPGWGANGISFARASGQYASCGWLGISGSITAMAVHAVSSISTAHRVIQFRGGAARGGLWSPFSDGAGYWDAINQEVARTSAALGASANTFFSHIGIGSASGIAQYRNGSVTVSSSATPASFNFTPSAFEIGRNDLTATLDSTVAFVLLAQTAALTANRWHDLYKNTLGQGLGLQ